MSFCCPAGGSYVVHVNPMGTKIVQSYAGSDEAKTAVLAFSFHCSGDAGAGWMASYNPCTSNFDITYIPEFDPYWFGFYGGFGRLWGGGGMQGSQGENSIWVTCAPIL